MRADWVYRPFERSLESGGLLQSPPGTYDTVEVSQAAGIANAQSRILYDSKDYIAHLTTRGIVSAGVARMLPGEARSEGRKPCMRAVEGVIFVTPSDWALGNSIKLGLRLGVWEQAMDTGTFLIDADYSMWSTSAVPHSTPSLWANNTRNNAMERRYAFAFNNEVVTPTFTLKFRWRGRKFLEPNECFGVYQETETGSSGIRTEYWLRTLVEDEG